MEPAEDTTLYQSINKCNQMAFEEYKDFLNKAIMLNNRSSIFYYMHLENFLSVYKGNLGIEAYFFKEKLFYVCLELKKVKKAHMLITDIYKEFGSEKPIIRMLSEKNEIDPKNEGTTSLEKYKQLILYNQDDRRSLKRYLMLMKFSYSNAEVRNYIELWNEYLKVYMDDSDGWNELAEVYLSTQNFTKAIFCFEELLLHNPNNYIILIKIGDIQSSFNNNESASIALKYYSQSALIKPTPRAFWGILYCLNIIAKNQKSLDQSQKSLYKISKIQIENMYINSPFKINVESFFTISI